MSASIDECVELQIAAASEDDRGIADEGSFEIAGWGNSASSATVIPGPVREKCDAVRVRKSQLEEDAIGNCGDAGGIPSERAVVGPRRI